MKRICVFLVGLGLLQAQAHPMPSSVVLLELGDSRVEAELQIPLSELNLALGRDVNAVPSLDADEQKTLSEYLLQHTRPTTTDGKAWQVAVNKLALAESQQTSNGPYRELQAHLTLTPPTGANPRWFTLHYDAVVHQVATHSVLVALRQASGLEATNIGVIRLDPVNNRIAPVEVNRSGGSLASGFWGMFRTGVSHIAEGTDHLLFLLTLLLPAALLAGRRRWGAFVGVRVALLNIFKIVTAFTVGHSLTLILGVLLKLHIPPQPIEVLIALSILVSAVHALRPLFPGREVWVAGGFGLIHGMAFSLTLAELQLGTAQMALSLLGFNLGIEAMQLVVIALTLPWLLLLARTGLYSKVRIAGAVLAALAALGWMGQRLGWPNALGNLADALSPYGVWLIAGVAVLAILTTLLPQTRKPQVPL